MFLDVDIVCSCHLVRGVASVSQFPTSTHQIEEMSTVEISNSLKEASVETLRSILSENQDVRKAGESQVQALEVTEGDICSFCSFWSLVDVLFFFTF